MDTVSFQSQEIPRSHTCYGFYNIWVCVVSVTIRPYNHNMSIDASMHLPTFVLPHCIRILIHTTNAPEPKNDQTHTSVFILCFLCVLVCMYLLHSCISRRECWLPEQPSNVTSCPLAHSFHLLVFVQFLIQGSF